MLEGVGETIQHVQGVAVGGFVLEAAGLMNAKVLQDGSIMAFNEMEGTVTYLNQLLTKQETR